MDELHLTALISVVIGIVVGAIWMRLMIFHKYDAILHVRQDDPEADRFNFIVLCPLDDIPKKKRMIVEVKKT